MGGLYSGGGQVGHGPWTTGQIQQQQPQPQQAPSHPQQGQPNPMKMPQGIPSAAPRSMDPRVMQQQMMQRAMMGQQQRPRMQEGGTPEIPQEFLEDFKRKKYEDMLDDYHRWKEDYDRRQDLAPTQEAAGGGRIGMMYGGDPGFAFEYGGSWADWHDQHRNQMPVEDYIQTKLPKERLPFRDSAQTGGRIGFGLGGIDKGRRAFMKWLAGIMGTGVAAGTGLLKLGTAAKVAKPAAVVTETIIKSNAPGMPVWFPSLVRRVLKEGKDETEKLATLERQTVHTAKTPEGTPIQVTRDLATDDIVVDIGEQAKHSWASGRYGQSVRLELKKGEWIEPSTEGGGYMTKGGDNVYPGMSKGALETEKTTGKGMKTKDEFWVEEAEFTGGHPENIKFDESVGFKYGEHGSDFSEVERYAIGKNKDKKIVGKQATRDEWAEGRAMEQAEDIDDFASGGLAYLLGE